MIGFVFVNIKGGRDKEFIDLIRSYPEVVEAHLTTGLHDAMLVIHGRDARDISDFNVNRLRVLRDVEDTYVCTSMATIKV